MEKYERTYMLGTSGQLDLTGIPFEKGQTVRVTVEIETEEMQLERKEKGRKAWAEFMALSEIERPNFPQITDEEINEEIAAYRRGE